MATVKDLFNGKAKKEEEEPSFNNGSVVLEWVQAKRDAPKRGVTMAENNNGKLVMLDFYYPHFSFKQVKVKGKVTLRTDFQINFGRNNDDASLIRVVIDTTVHDEDDIFHLELQALGLFRMPNGMSASDGGVDHRLEKDAVALMIPCIRSEIVLLTAQPGLTPVVLQPIDADEFLSNMKIARNASAS